MLLTCNVRSGFELLRDVTDDRKPRRKTVFSLLLSEPEGKHNNSVLCLYFLLHNHICRQAILCMRRIFSQRHFPFHTHHLLRNLSIGTVVYGPKTLMTMNMRILGKKGNKVCARLSFATSQTRDPPSKPLSILLYATMLRNSNESSKISNVNDDSYSVHVFHNVESSMRDERLTTLNLYVLHHRCITNESLR